MELIHSSNYYAFFQSDKERCFYIDFGQKVVRLSFCQLLALRQKVWAIRIEDHFDGELNAHGFEILALCNKEHLFVLNTLEILDLKELLIGAFSLFDICVPTSTRAQRV
ncbi:MAG: hypothetical protein CML04_05160 [Pseudozobellia sp.]|nr:hypothetical protein [Pseudozobellia sp.]MBG46867.1 hypothetical protein [Pseudozobellia sp.]|tara:strand:+ start:334 stop:660 length:327 start_codon:yes stop_codon:yes gene_type:complete